MIASKYVVTAAHCMFSITDGSPWTERDISVSLGDHNIDIFGETQIPEKTIQVVNIIKHENYINVLAGDDIALLELAEEVDLNVYTPACMARSSDVTTFDGVMAQAYGWGRTEDGGISKTLLEVDVPVVTNQECNEAFVKLSNINFFSFPPINAGQICAGGVKGEDTCAVHEQKSFFHNK